MSPSPNNGLFIPLEVFKREYINKLLLAAEVATRGMPVFIGHKSSIIRLVKAAKEPGIFFYKSSEGPGCEYFDDLRLKGFKIVAQDEESGTVYDHFSKFYERRSSLQTAANLDMFFCWGHDDYNYIRTMSPGREDKIKITGSPRTCLWGRHGQEYYREQIENIQKKYGPFVLIASNFASGNGYLSDKETIALMASYPSWTPEEQARHAERVSFDNRMIRLLVEASNEITSSGKHNIVIRPHPSENIETWRNLIKGNSRIFLEPDGDITPWILSAKCIIQNGCTSALEASAANIPTLAFGETETDIFNRDNSIPNQSSIPVIGIKALQNALQGIDTLWPKCAEKRKEILDRKLLNAGTLLPVTTITDYLYSLIDVPNTEGNKNLRRDSFLYDLYEWYRMSKLRRRSRAVIMDQAKRPTLSTSKVRKDLSRLLPILGHPNSLNVVRVAPSCFRISLKK